MPSSYSHICTLKFSSKDAIYYESKNVTHVKNLFGLNSKTVVILPKTSVQNTVRTKSYNRWNKMEREKKKVVFFNTKVLQVSSFLTWRGQNKWAKRIDFFSVFKGYNSSI